MLVVYPVPIPHRSSKEERLSEEIGEAVRENLVTPVDLAASKLVKAYSSGKAVYMLGEGLREFAQSTIPNGKYTLKYIALKDKEGFAKLLGLRPEDAKYVRSGFFAIVDGWKEFYGTSGFIRINPVPGSIEKARADEAFDTKVTLGIVAGCVALWGLIMAATHNSEKKHNML